MLLFPQEYFNDGSSLGDAGKVVAEASAITIVPIFPLTFVLKSSDNWNIEKQIYT
jgi:hypothetical protein